MQLGATTDSLIRGGYWRFQAPILPRQALRRAVYDEAHVIKPEPGPTEPALTAYDRGTRLNVFETEI